MSKLTFASLDFNATQTPVSTAFDDIYFSTQDGLAESEYVFLQGNNLWQKWQHHSTSHFVIAETGFGTGLNFFTVAQHFQQFRQENPNHTLKRLYFISFEKYPLNTEQLKQVHTYFPQFAKFVEKLTAHWRPLQTGCQRYHFDQIYLDVWFGDLSENLPQLGDHYRNSIDCWFLDGFSPDKNPEMWQDNLYRQMFRLSKSGGSFATFTAASRVRKGLQAVGFTVKKCKGFGKKREMLQGEKPVDARIAEANAPYFLPDCAYKHHHKPDDIAIVGGGVASVYVAWSLLMRGKKVTLYCQDGQLAQNASGNTQGAIYPQLSDDDERNIRFYVHAADYALQRITDLTQAVDIEHNFAGVALSAYNEKTAKKLDKIAQQGWHPNLFQRCNATELSQKIGLPVEKGGAFIGLGGWLSPKQLVENGLTYLETLGLTIVKNHQVADIHFRNHQWQWQHKGKTFAHDILILANGHQLKAFPQAEGIPLYPVRGQVSQITTTEQLQRLRCVVCYDGYITPVSASNTHCIGASHIRDNTETDIRLEEHQQNIAKLQQNITACPMDKSWTAELEQQHFQSKVGIRAALRDRLPMVGVMPNSTAQKQQYANLYNQRRRQEPIAQAHSFEQLYLIAGLGSRGLTTAPLLGEILAAQICGEPIPLSEDILHALSPNRTWIRQLLKGRQ